MKTETSWTIQSCCFSSSTIRYLYTSNSRLDLSQHFILALTWVVYSSRMWMLLQVLSLISLRVTQIPLLVRREKCLVMFRISKRLSITCPSSNNNRLKEASANPRFYNSSNSNSSTLDHLTSKGLVKWMGPVTPSVLPLKLSRTREDPFSLYPSNILPAKLNTLRMPHTLQMYLRHKPWEQPMPLCLPNRIKLCKIWEKWVTTHKELLILTRIKGKVCQIQYIIRIPILQWINLWWLLNKEKWWKGNSPVASVAKVTLEPVLTQCRALRSSTKKLCRWTCRVAKQAATASTQSWQTSSKKCTNKCNSSKH